MCYTLWACLLVFDEHDQIGVSRDSIPRTFSRRGIRLNERERILRTLYLVVLHTTRSLEPSDGEGLEYLDGEDEVAPITPAATLLAQTEFFKVDRRRSIGHLCYFLRKRGY